MQVHTKLFYPETNGGSAHKIYLFGWEFEKVIERIIQGNKGKIQYTLFSKVSGLLFPEAH